MFLFEFPILSLLIWLPIVGGLWVLFAGGNSQNIARWGSLVIAFVTFLVSVRMYFAFDVGARHGSNCLTSITTWALTASRCRLFC